MIKYEWREYKERVPKSTICDLCGKEVIHPNKESAGDVGNIIHIGKVFGYGSEFDGMLLEMDICEKCFIEKIGGLMVDNHLKGIDE
jgi:hypothetical protein